MKSNRTTGLLVAYLFLCLLLGGASAAGLWANVLLQLLAILFLFAAATARPEVPLSRSGRQLLMLFLLMLAVVIIQIVPMPPAVWTALPGRDPVREGFEMLGQPLPWLSLSLAPHQTVASALWLLPAAAMLLAGLRLGLRGAWIGWTIIGAMVLSVLVGAMQITGGDQSPWYFYAITNYGVTVGFFANANHLATLLVSTVPFLGALYMAGRGTGRSSQRSAGLFVILGGFFALVIVGLIINGSLAGLGLMLPVSAATWLLMNRERRVPLWSLGVLALLTAASVAAIFSGRFDNNLINPSAQTSVISRYTSFTTSFEAVKNHFPFGSGIGTFRAVYRMHEDPARVTNTYVNHVHSDWIEIVLEAGLPALALALLFLAWWGRRTLVIWQAPEPDWFGRAATIATAAILAHSLVDYPLRTAAIAALFAACCVLMTGPPARAGRGNRSWPAKRPARHLEAD